MAKIFRLAPALAALALITGGVAMAAAPRIVPPAGTPAATTHLNPNTATEAQLNAIPNGSPELTRAIIQGRPYATQAALIKVVGSRVAAAQQPAVYAAVFVPIKLNTATKEEILSIPGVIDRMVREFEEYRPYTSLDQFKREIGKYVDATELARLASYVTLN